LVLTLAEIAYILHTDHTVFALFRKNVPELKCNVICYYIPNTEKGLLNKRTLLEQ
jgi:hypothetical protein